MEKVTQLKPAHNLSVQSMDNGFVVESSRRQVDCNYTTKTIKMIFSSIDSTMNHIRNELTQNKELIEQTKD